MAVTVEGEDTTAATSLSSDDPGAPSKDRGAGWRSLLEPLRGWRHGTLPRWLPWLVFAAGLIGEAAVLVVQDRRLWFFRDDFAFLLERHISQHPVDRDGSPVSIRQERWTAI